MIRNYLHPGIDCIITHLGGQNEESTCFYVWIEIRLSG